MPALLVRGKSTATSFEMIEDDWREVYSALASEVVGFIRGEKKISAKVDDLLYAIELVEAGRESSENSADRKVG